MLVSTPSVAPRGSVSTVGLSSTVWPPYLLPDIVLLRVSGYMLAVGSVWLPGCRTSYIRTGWEDSAAGSHRRHTRRTHASRHAHSGAGDRGVRGTARTVVACADWSPPSRCQCHRRGTPYSRRPPAPISIGAG